MTYKLEFEEHALKEFKKLGTSVREQFTKKLKEVYKIPTFPPTEFMEWRLLQNQTSFRWLSASVSSDRA